MYRTKSVSRVETGAAVIVIAVYAIGISLIVLWEWLTRKGKMMLACVALITFCAFIGAAASKDPTPFLAEFGRIFGRGVIVAAIALFVAGLPSGETRFDRWLKRTWSREKEAFQDDPIILPLALFAPFGLSAITMLAANYFIGPGDHLPRAIFG